jgi:hypothetical protein
MGGLQSQRELAKELEVHPRTVGDIVRKLSIETHAIPTNGRARGLDRAAVKLIKGLLTPKKGKRP